MLSAAKQLSQMDISSQSMVNTVVSVAPTLGDTPKTGIAKNIFVLQRTHDGDTPIGGESIGIYDYVNAWSKHLLWMHGANHGFFLDGVQAPDLNNAMGATALTAEDLETRAGDAAQ